MEKRIAIMRTRCIHATATGKCNYCDGLSMNCHGDTCPNYEREPYSYTHCVTKSLYHPKWNHEWEDIAPICGATGEPCIMGMYCNCLCCKFEFTSFARHINGRYYLARPLSPRIVTYCAHVKGAKALNLPF